MRHTFLTTMTIALLAWASSAALAAEPVAPAVNPAYDAELAQRVGADENGMRKYVLVIL